MTIDASTGAFGWSPTESQGGLTPSVTVTVTDDGTGNITDSETFTIFVGDTNVAPVLAAIGNQAVNEGSTPIITLTATDADLPAQTLVFSISGGADAARFTINPTTGVLSFAGAPDYESPSDANLDNVYDVTVQVSDGSLASTQAISVTVINLDDTAPVLGANRLSIVQGGSAVPVIAATDADSSSAQISFTVSGLSGGTFELAGAPGVAVTVFTQADVNAGLVRFVSDGAEAAPAYQLTPSDGVNAGVAQAATVSFTNTNDAPVITSNGGAPAATIALAENSLQVTTITATDADALDVLRFAISGGADAARFSIDAASGALRFVVAPDSEQPADANADNRYEVIVSVSDGSLQAQQSLSIDVINVNEPPTIVVNWLLLSKGGTTLVLLGTDQESAADALNYAVSGVVGGQFEYLAAPGVAITGFNQAEVNAGAVRFVVDASGASPTYSLTLSDGVSVVTAPSPGVFIEAAPPPPPVNPFPVASNPPPTQAPPSPAPVQAAKPVVAKPQALAPGPGRLSQDLLSERSDAVYEPMQARLNAATSSALAPDGLTTRDTYTTPVTNLDHFALVSEGSVDAATPGLVKLDLVSALRERLLGKELNQLHDAEQTRRHAVQNLQFAGAILVSGLSIGYVLWLARGGVLMASLMSALPAWTSVDPLPVLARSKRRDPKDDPARDDRDAESALERMFSKPGTTRTNGASNGANSAQAATSAQATGTLQAQAKAPADPRSLEEPA
ncbi:MAG: cadherin domain-containing protein [Burkholderiales bacterium]|nr:cadherin domain-containing protein [Burkholderiales bacterium]